MRCALLVTLALLVTAAGSAHAQHGLPAPSRLPGSGFKPIPLNPGAIHVGHDANAKSGDDDWAPWIGGFTFLAIVGYLVIGWHRSRPAPPPQIRALSPPDGEPPLEIRRAWTEVLLSLAPGETGPRTFPVVGVLSHENCAPVEGYAVVGRAGVDLLAKSNPEAAAWWRQNAPHVLEPGYRLIFPAQNCCLFPAS